MQVGEADEQIGVLCEVLHEQGIPNALPSADKGSDSYNCCPPSSISTGHNEANSDSTSEEPGPKESTMLKCQ